MFSNEILSQWEKEQEVAVTARSLKRAQLEKALRKCGLSPSKVSIAHLRLLLSSLSRVKLPREPSAVADELTNKYGKKINGSRV